MFLLALLDRTTGTADKMMMVVVVVMVCERYEGEGSQMNLK